MTKSLMKSTLAAALALSLNFAAQAEVSLTPMKGTQTMQLSQEWDKIFPQSDKVEHHKVLFKNRYERLRSTRSLGVTGASAARVDWAFAGRSDKTASARPAPDKSFGHWLICRLNDHRLWRPRTPAPP